MESVDFQETAAILNLRQKSAHPGSLILIEIRFQVSEKKRDDLNNNERNEELYQECFIAPNTWQNLKWQQI